MTPLLVAFAVIFACGACFGVAMFSLLIAAGEDERPYLDEHADEMAALGRATRRPR